MKIKYYLRGLGIGIVVTAIIMGVSANGKTESLTDAQIIARAKELGMVDGVLSELPEAETDGTEASDGEETSPEETEAGSDAADENTESDEAKAEEDGPQEEEIDMDLEHFEAGGEPEAQDGDGEDGAEGAGEAEAAGAEESDVTIYTVAVYPGEGSYTVSRKLAALGLVESANLFDDFLCQNGYDKKLCTGNYRVKEGANAEEIAKVLTGQLTY